MKRKFSRILGVVAVIALLASFLAAPISADIGQAKIDLDNATDTGSEISATAEYTITFDVTDALLLPDTALIDFEKGSGTGTAAEWSASPDGRLSAYLSDGGTGYDTDTNFYGRVVVTPSTPILLADLLTVGDLSYWFNYFDDVSTGYPDAFPYMILAIDSAGAASVDGYIVLLSGGESYTPAQDTWVKWDLGEWDSWHGATGSASGVTYGSDLATFSGALTGATVVDVKVAVGEWHTGTYTPITGYVDDIEIEGTTYNEGGTITIEFPEDFDITGITDAADADVTVGASSGIGESALDAQACLSGISTTTNDDDTLNIKVWGDIGAGATVQVVIDGVVNNDDIGDYTLEVSTSEEDDPVTSETFTLEVPDVGVLPGIVEVYNPSGILMDSDTGSGAIEAMLKAADEGWTIKIGEGEYTENPDTGDLKGGAGATDVTIEGSGDVEDIIIVGDWTIDEDDITIDNLTLDGDITVIADDFTIQNCIVDDGGTLRIGTNGTDATVEDTTFNVEDDVGIAVDADDTVITDCTFNIEEDGVGISVENGGTDTDVSDSTFTGSSGVGINVTDDDSILDVEGSTFDGLETALDIDAGTVGITGNTIQNCEDDAIIVTTAAGVTLVANTITGNDDAVLLRVEANAGLVQMIFNTITDNAGDDDGLLIDNNDGDVDLFVVNNWWGDADGPGDDAFSDDVVSEPFLVGPISANADLDTSVAAGTTADFEDTAGVTVESTGFEMEVVAAAQYTVNPLEAIDDAVGFWDVYVINDTDDITGLEVRIYTDVTKYTEVWVWGAARGEWLKASTVTPNMFGGFVLVGIDDSTGTPIVADLEGLPFVVVDSGEAAADAVEITAPTVGAVDVSVTPTLAWEAVEDATYEIQIAQDASFAILDEAATSPTNAYIVTTALAEGASYYWRVRAVTDAGAGDWATGVFTTAAPEPEPTPPITIEEAAPPEITVTIPAPTVTQAIDPGLLWAIIGVGAVLVISLIVLIVRTRRAV